MKLLSSRHCLRTHICSVWCTQMDSISNQLYRVRFHSEILSKCCTKYNKHVFGDISVKFNVFLVYLFFFFDSFDQWMQCNLIRDLIGLVWRKHTEMKRISLILLMYMLLTHLVLLPIAMVQRDDSDNLTCCDY